MIKREELTNPDSCMSRAREDEMTFVLLERDAAAPVAIRAWINERLRLGKNMGYDKQILNALEVARTMESSPSVPAATQEQPAGSGAKRSDKMEFVKLKFSGVREVVINSCEWKDLQIALKGDRMSYACFEAEEVSAPGSPRKVGEDAPFAYVCPANCGCMWRDNGDFTMSLFGKRSQSCEVCEPLPLTALMPVYAARAKVGDEVTWIGQEGKRFTERIRRITEPQPGNYVFWVGEDEFPVNHQEVELVARPSSAPVGEQKEEEGV